ncbi:MAG TPA: heme-binding domain-containing protein [Lentimicrobium sp.]|nr:heme-binding domain-containing protein [Lentimicrobium sp.]
MKKSVVVWTIIVLIVLIQFIRIEQENPQSNPQYEFFNVASVPQNVQAVFIASCYDCHSNHTNYPWYSNVAPVSWMMANHIKEGREHMNFSEWGNYSKKDKLKMIEESIEEIDKGKMPLKSYVLIHKDARLTPEEKEIIRTQFLKEGAIGSIAALN